MRITQGITAGVTPSEDTEELRREVQEPHGIEECIEDLEGLHRPANRSTFAPPPPASILRLRSRASR
ncbi:hypothetical protein F750_6876 [Streptomyces sp. PAMC 26508]|nr:hypothetical protein F750_6876 [Streptomyces sp. PAMC 26508]